MSMWEDTVTIAIATNDYWDAVKDHATPSGYSWDNGALMVGAPSNDPNWWRHVGDRNDLASRYSWTITDPTTVAFVAQHAGPKAVDPMAGSGWWALLLGEAGVDTLASDLHPAGSEGNHWHKRADCWVPIGVSDGATTAAEHGANRTLLLSWPPYDDSAGADILAAYPGERVIYIGEGPGGCCGTDSMFDLFETGWVEVASHRPVQWYGIHDYVTVYDRRPG